jgi:transposase
MAILTVGVDLAKNVFALHGVNETGAVQLRQPKVVRAKLNALMASLPPCTIGMEACSGAHHWARLFAAHGHTVKLMAPKLVSPYRMSGKHGKNDAADAAAICEAVQRPNMRFVRVKTLDQQSQLMVHRARQGFVAARTATINRIRGLLAEFGVVLPQKAEVVRRQGGPARLGQYGDRRPAQRSASSGPASQAVRRARAQDGTRVHASAAADAADGHR